MSKKQQQKKRQKPGTGTRVIQLPKDAIRRVNLGQSFAEYDRILMKPGVFVSTPALSAALDGSLSKCFFVGRRGTGKTAVTYYLLQHSGAVQIYPQALSPLLFPLDPQELLDPHQRAFRTLVAVFKRALLDEVLGEWLTRHHIEERHLPQGLAKEIRYYKEFDFDLRLLEFLDYLCQPLEEKNEKKWLREMNKCKQLALEMEELFQDLGCRVPIVIDRIDDSWDGSIEAVAMLMALMHACIEMSSNYRCVQPLVFLRENVFDRVRAIDPESTRLETCVVSMEWTKELLLEMIERRLSHPFNTKLPLRGPTWHYFFEDTATQRSEELIFEYCQNRPRDVLTYCSIAFEIAQAKRHEKVLVDDILEARRRFSETRLKDLGDEYSENYAQISRVLTKFYGLGNEYSFQGIDAFIRKLLLDTEIQELCKGWIYSYTPPEQFIRLLYNIGFLGIRTDSGILFRSVGPTSTTPPPITPETNVVVHPSYEAALDLRQAIITDVDHQISWQSAGLLTELPEELTITDYCARLQSLQSQIKSLSRGKQFAKEWESLVGEVIKLCFYKWLGNVEPHERDMNGVVIRDWIAANRASYGFWEMIRQRYDATQIVWECKNYEKLAAGDFQQVAYYLNKRIGKCCVIAFRGEIQKHYYEHIKRIAEATDGIILLFTERDLLTFVRQAEKGKFTENHIRDVFDRTVRMIG